MRSVQGGQRVCGFLLPPVLCLVFAHAAPAQDAKSQAAARDYNAAAALQNSGLYDRAAERWAAFVRDYPADPRLDRAHYHLGVCRLHTKQYAEAAAALEHVLAKYPNFESADGAQYNLGMARFQIASASNKPDDFKAAAAALDAAAKHPKGRYAARALYYQGEALVSASEAKAAVEVFQKLLREHRDGPLRADALYALGTAQQDLKLLDDAASTFKAFLDDAALAKHDLAGEVRLRLAMSLFDAKKHAEAQAHFAAAAALPGFAQGDFAMLRHGQCLVEAGKPREAAAVLAALRQKHPQSPYRSAAQLAAGKCYVATEQYDEARKALADLASAGEEESPEAAYWLARSLLKLNRPREALAALDRALGRNRKGPFTPHLECARIDALYDLPDRRGEVRPLCEKFLQAHPDHELAAQARYMAALAALGQKDYAAARTHADAFLADGKLAEHELVAAVLYVAAESRLLDARSTTADVAQAEDLYRRLVAKHPKHPRAAHALLRIGWCLDQAKKHEAALAHLRGAVASLKDPAHVAEAQVLMGRALYQLGDAAAAQGKTSEAAARFGEVVERFAKSPSAAPASYRLAAIRFAKEDYAGTLAALEAVLSGPADAELAAQARRLRGIVHQRQKRYEAALADLQAFVQANPSAAEAADARYAMVLCRAGLGQLDQAASEAEALVKARPDYPYADKVYYEWGHALLGRKKAPEAAAAFRNLAERAPDSPLAAESWFHVGRWHEDSAEAAAGQDQKKAQWGSAAEAYSSGLAKARSPELREKLQYKLGDVQFRLHQFDRAAATLAAQLEAFPKGPLAGPARFLAAESLFRQGQPEKAYPLFQKVLDEKLEQYQAQALYRAGACAAAMKKWPESQKHYETLLAQFSKFDQAAEARYGIAVALQNQGRWPDAKAVYEKVAKEEGEAAAKAHFMLGEIAFGEKRYADAVEKYLLVAVGYPYKEWQALARFEAGRCLIELGRKEKAIESLRIVVDQFPDHPRAKDAARLIEEIKR